MAIKSMVGVATGVVGENFEGKMRDSVNSLPEVADLCYISPFAASR